MDYYFDVDCVKNAYNNFQGKLKNKSWGLLCVMKQLDKTIVPGQTYTFSGKALSEYILKLFCLSKGKPEESSEWYVKFSTQWYGFFNQQSRGEKPNIFDAIVWAYRKEPMPDGISNADLIKKFAEDFHIEDSLIPIIFDTTSRSLSYDTKLYKEADLKTAIFAPPVSVDDNMTADRKLGKDSVGTLAKGPFIRPLYTALETIEFFLLSQVDYDKFYPFNRKTTYKFINPDLPLQQIFYGAPGTGKSHEIKEKTKGQSVIRTTFHPDSDYSSFVGCYKPTMAEVNTHVVPVVVNSGIRLQPTATYKEKRITYQFVIQAFLKAYLAAWKKYADNNTSSSSSSLTIKTNGGRYTIIGADNQRVSYERIITYRLPNGNLATAWDEIWESGSFNIPKGGSGRSLEQSVLQWIYNKNYKKENYEEGLEVFIQTIKKEGEVEVSKNTSNAQKYVFSPSDKDGYFFVKTISHSSIDIVKKAFEDEEGYDNADEKIKKLVEKLREFGDDFGNAWVCLTEAVEQNGTVDATKDAIPEPAPQFLIIEEINRGNCAQIFGDLFQLLDRQDNGFSEYPIEADTDLQQEIERAFNEPGEYYLNGKIDVDSVIDDYTSNYGVSLSDDIQHGRILLLPSNLYIWATMNTSDQSLFPIDSAFKRRWDWKYVPIYDCKKGWRIEGDTNEFDWWSFLKKINGEIDILTHSEDKKLGYFFCKADNNGVISADKFVSKVIFYLWNDVFKDYDFEGDIFKDGKLSFNEFYDVDENGNTVVRKDKVQLFLEKNLELGTVEEDEDGNTPSSPKNFDKFSINGKGEYGKNQLATNCLTEYIKLHSSMSVDDVLKEWKTLGNIVPHFIESQAEYDARTDSNKNLSSQIPCGDTFIYVAKYGYIAGNGKVEKLIEAVNNKPWGLTLAKVEYLT